MRLNKTTEEFLADIYIKIEEERTESDNILSLLRNQDEETISLLNRDGFIEKTGGDYKITNDGLEFGRHMVRKQRLAEKLLVDILNVQRNFQEVACDFEHNINNEVEEKVCLLLGHPEFSPHGKPIPIGKCCIKARKDLGKLNILLSKLAPGDIADVTYLNTVNNVEMQKLISIGLLPGSRITIIRAFPSIVFENGNSQFAVDENIGGMVHLRRVHPVK